MATRQYIGARYVVKVYENSEVAGSAEWEENTVYEPLVLVTYQNGSYLSKKYVPSTVGNPAANTQYWVQTGFYNGQIANLQHQIDTLNEELDNELDVIGGQIDEIDNAIDDLQYDVKRIELNAKTLNANVVLNEFHLTSKGNANGSCYIGNGRVVTYFADYNGTDTGTLVCYNRSTYSIMWQYSIKGYHGNSITYNPNNNHIYICGCITAANERINIIVEIDIDNPSSIIREINLPNITECYSLAYDVSTDKFYATPYVGTTAGTSNMLCVYNSTLTTLEKTILLDEYPAVKYGLSTQGVQAAINGIAYILCYDTNGRGVYGYDVENNALVNISILPFYANMCRQLGEPESIVWDYDNEDFLIGVVTHFSGVYHYMIWSLIEVDMFKGIQTIYPKVQNDYFGANSPGVQRAVGYVLGSDTLKPTWLINDVIFPCPNDALNYARIRNIPLLLIGHRSISNISGLGDEMFNLQTQGFNGEIDGPSNADKFKIHQFMARESCNVTFRYMEFDGFECTALSSGYWCNVFAQYLCKLFFQSCVFDEYTATGNNKYHLIAFNGAHCYSFGNTMNGTVDNNYLTGVLGEVTHE